MKYEWDVLADGTQHHVALEEGWLSVDENAAVPLRQYKRKEHLKEREFLIPIGNQTAALHILKQKNSDPVLSFQGRNCATGEVYEVQKVPGWGWIFIVLYAINYYAVLGGALGGLVSGGCIAATLGIAAKKEMSTAQKVLLSVGLYIAATVVSVIVAIKIATMLLR